MFQRSAHLKDIPGNSLLPFPNDRNVKLLASPSIVRNTEHVAVGLVQIAPDHVHEEHEHAAEEVMYIIKGRGEVVIQGKERVLLKPETVVILKPNERHMIKVTGAETLEILWVYAPPGPEKKFVSGAGCPALEEGESSYE